MFASSQKKTVSTLSSPIHHSVVQNTTVWPQTFVTLRKQHQSHSSSTSWRIGTKEIWYYEVEAVGFSLSKSQKLIPENDLPDCLEKAKKREVSEKSWLITVEDIVARNYDLSAVNPNAKAAKKHRSPTFIAADIAQKQERILEIMEEIQELMNDEESIEEER